MSAKLTLSKRDAAMEFGCSTKTIERLIAKGELKAFQIIGGGHWRIRRADVVECINRRLALQAQRTGKIGKKVDTKNHHGADGYA